MCKPSQEADRVVGMEERKRYSVGRAKAGLAALTPYGMQATDCVACAQTGAVLTLIGIPLALQQKHDIGARAVVTFVQTGHNMQDQLELEGGKQVSLMEFADQNIGVYAGVLEDLDTVEEPAPGAVRNPTTEEVIRV